jgi:integrase/recombinase XerD
MNPTTGDISPLRQRMLDEMRMRMRKLEPKTQAAYVRAVRKLAGFLRRPPDTASVEDLRRFQLQLIDEGTSAVSSRTLT